MIDTKILDDFTRRIASLLPKGLDGLSQEIEKQLRIGLENLFEQLDLVTRDEYEVQVALLARSREKLKELEAQLRVLENACGIPTPTVTPSKLIQED